MKELPVVKYHLPRTDVALEITGWVVLAAFWVLLIINFRALPYIIPSHFNAAGQADAFTVKFDILTLPIIASLLFGVLTIANLLPEVSNFPDKLTTKHAERLYDNAMRLIRVLKIILVLTFAYVVYQSVQYAKGLSDGLGSWFLPVVILVTFLPVAVYIAGFFRKH